MTNYITYTDVLNLLRGVDLTTDLPTINADITNIFIPMAQAEINAYLGYSILETTATKYYNGSNVQELCLRVRPVQNVTECVVYSVPYQSVWLTFAPSAIAKINTTDRRGNIITTENIPIQQTQLVLDCEKGILQIPITSATYAMIGVPINYPQFLAGVNNVKVSMTYGYSVANMPAEVKMACSYLAAILVMLAKGNVVGQGVISISIGQVSKSFAQGADKRKLPYAGLLSSFDSYVVKLLQPYRQIYV